MRKYLLLASVSGCLISANAMAATPSGRTAEINAHAEMIPAIVITGAQDISFGTLVYDNQHAPQSMTKIASLDGNSHVSIEDSNFIVQALDLGSGVGTASSGSLKVNTDKAIQHTITSCGQGTYSSTGCELSNGQSIVYIKNIGLNGNSGDYTFSADLYANGQLTQSSDTYAGTFTISLDY